MNLRLVQFSLGQGKQSVAEAIAAVVVPAIRALDGCERCEFFADNMLGDYGFIVIWESAQAANAAAPLISPILTRLLADAHATGDSRRLFEIYDPQ